MCADTAGAFQGPDQVPASGEPPNSIIADEFYANVLEQVRLLPSTHWLLCSNSLAQSALLGFAAGTHSHWLTGADCCLGFRGQRAWWASELQREGLMSLDLPSHPATTDGTTLRHMATHGIIRESHAPLCAL